MLRGGAETDEEDPFAVVVVASLVTEDLFHEEAAETGELELATEVVFVKLVGSVSFWLVKVSGDVVLVVGVLGSSILWFRE